MAKVEANTRFPRIFRQTRSRTLGEYRLSDGQTVLEDPDSRSKPSHQKVGEVYLKESRFRFSRTWTVVEKISNPNFEFRNE